MSDLIEELRWRGLVAQHTDEKALSEAFEDGPVTFYCGYDPTAPSLHHGHLVQLILMRHLQNAGHKPLALVGGATGLIGDPREVGERSMNDTSIVEEWAARLRAQIERFLDFDAEDNPARMVNNLDWTGEISAIGLLRDLGKHFRLGTMLSKDIVARRLKSDEGISYTEFSYQILQANDYLELFRRYGCTLQTGGNDQWGNLIGGMDLIRRVEGKGVHAMTTPVITKADGSKFGKSEGGAIWLDPAMMSPYDFYQFWLQTADEDVVRMLKVFTFLDRERIEELEAITAERPQAREAQRVLAAEVTRFVHGEDELQRVQAATNALWGRGDLHEVDSETLAAAIQDLPKAEIVLGETTVIDALVATGLEAGRKAAVRTVSSNGLSVNNVKVADVDRVFVPEDVLAGGVVLLRKGRKTLAAAVVEA
ncbi:tyrosine--tRNA ligase [Actinomyces minihominis]|uniref:tyrosine--tRNA ligase n=1 Tax=Actinomyces minihominis TaxID=2002838 RepID=UPI000C08BA6E|nr:tyrosine--tRNA ligase [Actinomyces minihominis]